MEVLAVLHWHSNIVLRLSKKGSRRNYTSAFAFYPEHDCDSKACNELLFDKLNPFKFHTKLSACYAGTARNIPPTNKCRCDGTQALHGNAAPSFTALRRLFLLMAFSATHSTARPSHPQPKRNDLQAELRINILFPMKTVFLVPQYIIIIFLFNFRLRRQVKDDARLLEQVPLASGRPVSCVAVKRRWNENRILLSYAIIRCTLTCRRFFLLSTVPRSMKFPIVNRQIMIHVSQKSSTSRYDLQI